MLSKILRGLLFFGVAAGLLSLDYFRTSAQVQTETDTKYPGVNAPPYVTGPVYSQPISPRGNLFLSSQRVPGGTDYDQSVWDNFTLQSNQSITEIDWSGGYDPLKFGIGGPVVDFTVAIYPSIAAGTEPAVANPPLVTYQTGGSAGETSIGTVGGNPMNAYSFSLPAPFNASAGVKYWVYIVASQNGSSPDWCLAAGTGGDSSHYRWGSGSGGDSGYKTVPGDAAFTLIGSVADTLTPTLTATVTASSTLTLTSISTDTPTPIITPTSTPTPQVPPCFSPPIALVMVLFLFNLPNLLRLASA